MSSFHYYFVDPFAGAIEHYRLLMGLSLPISAPVLTRTYLG